MSRLLRRATAAYLGVAFALAPLPLHVCYAGDHDWKVASDVGAVALMAFAAGDTIAEEDPRGGKQLALSLGATALETYGLKEAFPEERPNGRDDRSFPSGHASIAFASAGYLQERYGWKVGLPATAAAAFVGLARVQAHEHHWYDAVAGAAVGEATALIITSPKDRNVQVWPWAGHGGGGISLRARF